MQLREIAGGPGQSSHRLQCSLGMRPEAGGALRRLPALPPAPGSGTCMPTRTRGSTSRPSSRTWAGSTRPGVRARASRHREGGSTPGPAGSGPPAICSPRTRARSARTRWLSTSPAACSAAAPIRRSGSSPTRAGDALEGPRRRHRSRRVRCPAIEAGGLYYSAVLTGNRLCATRCADVEVVCRAVP